MFNYYYLFMLDNSHSFPPPFFHIPFKQKHFRVHRVKMKILGKAHRKCQNYDPSMETHVLSSYNKLIMPYIPFFINLEKVISWKWLKIHKNIYFLYSIKKSKLQVLKNINNIQKYCNYLRIFLLWLLISLLLDAFNYYIFKLFILKKIWKIFVHYSSFGLYCRSN